MAYKWSEIWYVQPSCGFKFGSSVRIISKTLSTRNLGWSSPKLMAGSMSPVSTRVTVDTVADSKLMYIIWLYLVVWCSCQLQPASTGWFSQQPIYRVDGSRCSTLKTSENHQNRIGWWWILGANPSRPWRASPERWRSNRPRPENPPEGQSLWNCFLNPPGRKNMLETFAGHWFSRVCEITKPPTTTNHNQINQNSSQMCLFRGWYQLFSSQFLIFNKPKNNPRNTDRNAPQTTLEAVGPVIRNSVQPKVTAKATPQSRME